MIFRISLVIICFLTSLTLNSAELYDGKIIVKGKKHIEAKKILIMYDKLLYYKVGESNIDSISTSDVSFLIVKDGNYFPYGALLGGLFGYGIYYGSTPSPDIDAGESIYYTIAGAILGGIAGGLTTKTKNLRLYNNLSMNLNLKSVNLPITNMTNFQILSISLQI